LSRQTSQVEVFIFRRGSSVQMLELEKYFKKTVEFRDALLEEKVL